MAGRGKRGVDTAPKIRAAFFRAIEQIREKGGIAGLPDIMEEMIVNDPIKAFELLAKFTPKEVEVTEDSTVRIISGDPMATEDWEAQHLEGPPIETDTAH